MKRPTNAFVLKKTNENNNIYRGGNSGNGGSCSGGGSGQPGSNCKN